MPNLEQMDRDVKQLITNLRQVDAIHGSWGLEVSASHAVGNGDHYSVYMGTTGAAGITGTVPAAGVANLFRTLTFVKVDAGAGTYAVAGLGGVNDTLYLIGQGDNFTIQSDGTAWRVRSGVGAPVSGEPSAGTWHDVSSPIDAWLINGQVISVGTWYTATFPIGAGAGKCPVGTKKVKCFLQYLAPAAGSDNVSYRLFGVGGTNIARNVAVALTSSWGGGQIEVPVDSSGRVDFTAGRAGTLYIANAVAYSA
jgi:hypothetical protein